MIMALGARKYIDIEVGGPTDLDSWMQLAARAAELADVTRGRRNLPLLGAGPRSARPPGPGLRPRNSSWRGPSLKAPASALSLR